MTAPGPVSCRPSAGELIATAKAKAVPVVSCVAASLRPDHLLSGCSWEELAALVIVLAEAADPGRLREVVTAQDGPERGVPAERLRRAHAEVTRLRRAGREIPPYLRRLEREYSRTTKRRLRRAA